MEAIRFLTRKIWVEGNFGIRSKVVLSFSCLVLSKILAIFTPISFKWIVDGMNNQKALWWLVGIGIFYVTTRVLSQIVGEFRDALFSRVTQKTIRSVGLEVFNHLHNLDLSFHLERQTGGLNRTLERGIKGIETFFRFSVFNLVPTFFEVLLVFVFLWVQYGLIYGTLALSSVVLYVLYTFFITHKLIHYVKKMNDSDSNSNTKIIDSLLNYETVKYFNNESLEAKRLDDSLKLYQTNAVTSDLLRAYLNSGQSIIIALGLGIMIILAVLEVRAQTMTIGDFVLVNTLLIQLYIPLFMLGFAYREVKSSLAAIDGMLQFLNIKPKINNKENAFNLKFKNGVMEFKDVHFSYHDNREILKGISFKIDGGKTLAIVGGTGAGKSTIGKLIFRFFDIQKGQILIDNQNIQDVTQDSLRRLIGVVPQDTVLFNDTIYYNILYGKPDATEEEVIEASKKAEIHDFINSLPEKYETMVGERGLRLSGGEKQRVSIARVLLKQPRMFIFDEATSALDTLTEQMIQKNLENISKGFTTIIIAHRLSTIIHADKILVLEKGLVKEMGTHDELLMKKGAYYQMWEKQSKKEHD